MKRYNETEQEYQARKRREEDEKRRRNSWDNDIANPASILSPLNPIHSSAMDLHSSHCCDTSSWSSSCSDTSSSSSCGDW